MEKLIRKVLYFSRFEYIGGLKNSPPYLVLYSRKLGEISKEVSKWINTKIFYLKNPK